MRDPVRNAVAIHRTFHHPEFTLSFADALPEPKAVLALAPARSPEEPHQFAIHAVNLDATKAVLRAVPRGYCVYHVADELAFPAVRERIDVQWWGEAIYYRLDPDAFEDFSTPDVRPVEPRWAGLIAKIWAPEWPAEEYVRSRIEGGPTAGIYEDGELVAWNMTHLETGEVVLAGFLHVLEPYRGRGYGKTVGSALIKQILAKGKIPCCHVYVDNEVSIRLTESLGYRRVCLQAWGDGVAPP